MSEIKITALNGKDIKSGDILLISPSSMINAKGTSKKFKNIFNPEFFRILKEYEKDEEFEFRYFKGVWLLDGKEDIISIQVDIQVFVLI